MGNITENEIENFKERINVLKNSSSENRIKKQLLKSELKKKKNLLKEIGLNSVEEAKRKSNSLDKKINRLKEEIEDELYSLEKRLGKREFR